jgi:hypothetical protein
MISSRLLAADASGRGTRLIPFLSLLACVMLRESRQCLRPTARHQFVPLVGFVGINA